MALSLPRRDSRASLVVSVVSLIVFLLTGGGCQPEKAVEGRGLLPEAPPDQTTSTAAPTKFPFDQPLGETAFVRTVFQTSGPSNIAVTVRDVIVGPHGKALLPAVAGPVVIDVSSGSGSALIGDKKLELSLQNPVSVPAGATVALANTTDLPLVLRLYLLEGK